MRQKNRTPITGPPFLFFLWEGAGGAVFFKRRRVGFVLKSIRKKMLETGEMLNMSNVLNVLGEIRLEKAQNLTYLTFPEF